MWKHALILLLLFFITSLSGGIFAATMTRALVYTAPESEVPGTETLAVREERVVARDPHHPVHLSIPVIDVDAAIEPVGLGKTGNMAVPRSYYDVGWFRLGTVPGNAGNAVMAGHVTNGLQMPGVFYDLAELERGNDIVVETANGARMRFVVERVESYAFDDVPRTDIFRKEGTPRLILITCEGEWLDEEKTYDRRIVVYASLAAA
jgi:LPXTG-site transpeptidase (sortase) family protein